MNFEFENVLCLTSEETYIEQNNKSNIKCQSKRLQISDELS